MGRRLINFEAMPARFPEGTLGRIDLLLNKGEKRADFLRAAVARELNRRQQALDRIQTDPRRHKRRADRL